MFSSFHEKILIQEIRKGNKSAFSFFYDKYVDSVYRFIFIRVGVEDVARDLTSECFLKIFEFLKKEEVENFRAFIFKIARRKIIDFYRERSKKHTDSLDDVPEGELKNDDDLPLNYDLKKLKEAVSQLKEEYQEPVLLHYFEGFSWKEIADILDVSPSTLRQRAHRGIKLLKKNLRLDSNKDNK